MVLPHFLDEDDYPFVDRGIHISFLEVGLHLQHLMQAICFESYCKSGLSFPRIVFLYKRAGFICFPGQFWK